jgi:beta-glucanase (GH16 family)
MNSGEIGRRSFLIGAGCCVSAGLLAISADTEGAPAHASASVFDDFDGPAGSGPDRGLWTYRVGRGWDDGVQNYRPENAVLDGRGNLEIRAESTDRGYVSGRVQTVRGFGYGTTTARIKMPSGQGLWPAFWLIGADDDKAEIDVIELVSSTTTYYTTIHGPRVGGGPSYQVQFTGAVADLSDDYHEYWTTHLPGQITTGIDSVTLATFTPNSLPADGLWVYDRPMCAVLCMAVGGDWAGPPNASTRLPATMLVDWFRWESI